MSIFDIIILTLVSIGVILLIIVLMRQPKVERKSVIETKFDTVASLKDQLQYQIILENADDKQAAALATALSTIFKVTVGTESAEATIAAASISNAAQVKETESNLLSMLR